MVFFFGLVFKLSVWPSRIESTFVQRSNRLSLNLITLATIYVQALCFRKLLTEATHFHYLHPPEIFVYA